MGIRIINLLNPLKWPAAVFLTSFSTLSIYHLMVLEAWLGLYNFSSTAFLSDYLVMSALTTTTYGFLRTGFKSLIVASIIPVIALIPTDRFYAIFNLPVTGSDLYVIPDAAGFLTFVDLLPVFVVIGLFLFFASFNIKRIAKALTFTVLVSGATWAYLEVNDGQSHISINRGENQVNTFGRLRILADSSSQMINREEVVAEYSRGAWDDYYSSQRELVKGSISESSLPNVYVVVLESFYDFENSLYPVEPYFERYEREIQPFVGSAESPVVGGGSIAAEFEVLCGASSIAAIDLEGFYLPIAMQEPKCASTILKDLGYTMTSYHGGSPSDFSSDRVYEKIGFEDRHFFGEKNTVFTSEGLKVVDDGTIFRSIFEGDRALSGPGPKFTYMLGSYGHVPFKNDPERFPVIVDHPDMTDREERMVSQEYYRQKHIVEFIDLIKERDPDSVVIITGDHTPPLEVTRAAEKDYMKDEWEVPLIIYNQGEFVTLDQRIDLLEIHQVVFSLIGNESYCEKYNCYAERDRFSPDSVELLKSFLAEIKNA